MNDTSAAENLLNAIRERGAILYGAGYVAETFFHALERHQLQHAVRACVVTKRTDASTRFHGLEIQEIGVFAANNSAIMSLGDRQPILCISTHEAHAQAMYHTARQLGFTEVVWVYEILCELLYGSPVRTDEWIPVEDILAAQPMAWHWVAARQAALAQRYGIVEYGESSYVKCLSMHCSTGTAQSRLRNFDSLATTYEQQGIGALEPILVDEDMRVIDGLHRLALAAWHGEPSIRCNIVARNDVFDKVLTPENKLDPHVLNQSGLSAEERVLVERLNWQHSLGKADGLAPEVSIILPAYNVEGYIDECLESVVAQSFGDFEAIIVNDGSTDGTSIKCNAWSERDPRIRVIEQPNGGVSTARNRGIEEAKGAYLAFVDPDDWLDTRYLELLHNRALQTDADFIECDLWRYNERNGAKIWRHCGQRMGVPFTIEEHMKYGPTASYKSLSKRGLWIEHGVRFPNCSFESPAIYALLLALANGVEYLPEPLYYYRRFRENSLVETGYARKDGSSNNKLGIRAMEHLVEQFKYHDLYERYRSTLPGVVLYRLNDILAMQYHRKDERDFTDLVENYRAFIDRVLPDAFNEPYITWGGYNLNKILQEMNAMHDPACRFNFSSLIAIAHTGNQPCTAHHRNRYREMMLQREMDGSFWQLLEKVQPRYLIMDLIEERFDVVEWRGRYLTLSDAFEGAVFSTDADMCNHDEPCCLPHQNNPGEARPSGIESLPYREEAKILQRDSEECLELFRASVKQIARRLAEQLPDLRVIVVENYLSLEVGDLQHREQFAEADRIRAANGILSQLYDIVCAVFTDSVRIRAHEIDCYFTDQDYEYGAIPSHLNAIANEQIAQLVERELK